MSRIGSKCVRAAFVFACFAIAGAAKAATLVTFLAEPGTPDPSEFVFAGGTLSAGSGLSSNGNNQASGLKVGTPFVITGIAGGTPDLLAGTTSFSDASLSFSALSSAGPASLIGGSIFQPLGGGTFNLKATDGTLLLSGTITSPSVVDGIAGGDTANVLGPTVTYTGGAIYNKLIAAGGTPSGDLSFALIDATPALTIGPAPAGVLQDFVANGNGQFNVAAVPEPSAMLLALGAPALLALRRRRA